MNLREVIKDEEDQILAQSSVLNNDQPRKISTHDHDQPSNQSSTSAQDQVVQLITIARYRPFNQIVRDLRGGVRKHSRAIFTSLELT